MSRKGTVSVYRSKQIPRIFQRQRTATNARSWLTSEEGFSLHEQSDQSHYDLLPGSSYDYHQVKHENDKKEIPGKSTINKEFIEKTWNDESCQINEDSTGTQSMDSVERVGDANIEHWFKIRTDSVSSIDFEDIKIVPNYLADELTHNFLEKDSNSLSYDPILHELQTDKLLNTCTKDDEFSLPEFALDSLELTPDMMVAGEILPSTSALSSLNVPHIANDSCIPIQQTSTSLSLADDHDLRDKSTQVHTRDFDSLAEQVDNPENYLCDMKPINIYDFAGSEICAKLLDEQKTNGKTKDNMVKNISDFQVILKEESPADSSDGVMAVVAISTDKISNLTQIVINNGTEEQIYQGKTSELIEATGNFPSIDDNNIWNRRIDIDGENMTINRHDIIMTRALEDLGVTDEMLQPVCLADQGKTWICPRKDCHRYFNRLFALKSHLLTHYGVRPFKCDVEGCSWAFYSEFKLKRHRETHLKKKDYVCEEADCQRRFTTIYNLWSHKKLHERPNRIVCHVPECNEKFQTKRALEIHMKSHDEKHAPYQCNHEGCGKRYYSSNALSSHQRCHSYKETDIKCSWPGCGKVFDKPCRLKAHTRSHTGCKPYTCTFPGCQWAFASSSKLKRHQKKHTNDRKFVCELDSCGKAFMRSEHLKEHRLTHSLERYFQCYMCTSRFSAKSSLYVHIKKHHSKSDTSKLITTDESLPIDFDLSSGAYEPGDYLSLETELQTEIISREIFGSSDTTALLVEPEAKMVRAPKIPFHCPVETCTRSYSSKSSLRVHIHKIHGSSIPESAAPVTRAGLPDQVDHSSNTDFIVYTPYSMSQSINDQMIMVAPGDAVIFNSPANNDRVEPESSKVSPALKRKVENHQPRNNHGSARTGLTYSDVFKLKGNVKSEETTVVGAQDVIMGSTDLGEGFLFTEDIPSMYFQDECQVLLLDPVTSENTINLRDID